MIILKILFKMSFQAKRFSQIKIKMPFCQCFTIQWFTSRCMGNFSLVIKFVVFRTDCTHCVSLNTVLYLEKRCTNKIYILLLLSLYSIVKCAVSHRKIRAACRKCSPAVMVMMCCGYGQCSCVEDSWWVSVTAVEFYRLNSSIFALTQIVLCSFTYFILFLQQY